MLKTKRAWLVGIALVLCLLSLSSRALAAQKSEAEVRAAVLTWVHSITAEARPEATIEKMLPKTVDGRITSYIVLLDGGGYCLAGADDLVLPVYFYSPRGTYRPSDAGLQAIEHEIERRTLELNEASSKGTIPTAQVSTQLSERAAYWRDLSTGQVSIQRPSAAMATLDQMDLPLHCEWGQHAPYNAYCPTLPVPNNPTQTLVGCVATALAQIMDYWQWPQTGSGSHSRDYSYRWRSDWDEEPLAVDPQIPAQYNGRLDWTANNGGRLRMTGTWDNSIYNAARAYNADVDYQNALAALWARMNVSTSTFSANFGATTYNWSIMPDSGSNPPGAGDLEIAKLSEHLGIAVDMGWGVWFSGSDLWYAEQPLENYFRYDTDAVYQPDDINIMTAEIQWMRPFAFSGSDGSTGHVWVVFGYNKGTDPNRQFHMNMGWDGNDNGWYTVDAVPLNLTNCCTRHLTNIAPQGAVRFVGNTNSGDGSPDSPFRDIDEALSQVPDGTELVFRAGSTNNFAGTSLVIARPMTLVGHQATLQ